MTVSRTSLLRRLTDRVLEAPDLEGLVQVLTRTLPEALDVEGARLLLWDRKLETFEGLSLVLQGGETRIEPLRPAEPGSPLPEARYLISEGQVLETPGHGEGALVPLMARSGLVGMLMLDRPRRQRRSVYHRAEARLLTLLASRSALALENHLYQKELIASERMAALGTMAGMLAHDFRGPMTIIRGYAETLVEAGLTPAEVAARATLIVQSVDRLERMTAETLDFVRGSGRLARRTLGVSAFLNELAGGLTAELPGLEVVRDFNVPPGASAALDVDKLRRAVGNIAANARDAMGGTGRLYLSAVLESGNNEADSRLVLTLADEGPGVAAEVQERVFQPFATFGKKKGTGLGLAVSRRFVEDHGGTLELLPSPPPPEHGARFRIALPLGVPSPPRSEPAS
ncbi:MAG TPA: GAF domain-containing sensor histidine kinase [Vicinamibacteria bacterium]|jgi:signal transduction histidine kinase|nr:GAF domain-containing sensor histidine kinase [Vicinamibacteria bacterium]